MVYFTAHFYIIHILFNNVAGINLVVAHSDAVNLSYMCIFVCYPRVAPKFSFKWNEEVLDSVNVSMHHTQDATSDS